MTCFSKWTICGSNSCHFWTETLWPLLFPSLPRDLQYSRWKLFISLNTGAETRRSLFYKIFCQCILFQNLLTVYSLFLSGLTLNGALYTVWDNKHFDTTVLCGIWWSLIVAGITLCFLIDTQIGCYQSKENLKYVSLASREPVNSEKTVTWVMVCSGKTFLKLSPAVILNADNVLTELVPLTNWGNRVSCLL